MKEVQPTLEKRGNSPGKPRIISWALAPTQLLALTLPWVTREMVAPKMIESSREERGREFIIFVDSEGVDRAHRSGSAGSYNRQLLWERIWNPHGPSLALQGSHPFSIHNKGGRAAIAGALDHQGQRLAQRMSVSGLRSPYTLLPIPNPCSSVPVMIRWHPRTETESRRNESCKTFKRKIQKGN